MTDSTHRDRTLACRRRFGPTLGLMIVVLLMTGGCRNAQSSSASSSSSSTPGERSDKKAAIVAAPNSVTAPANTTTISWDVGERPTGQVYVSKDDGPERLFAEGPRNSQDANWIAKGKFEFRLYAGTDHQDRLATVVVQGN